MKLFISAILLCFLSTVAQSAQLPVFVYQFLNDDNFITGDSYYNGFESINDFDGFYITPPDYKGASSQDLSSEQVHSGLSAGKSWIYAQVPFVIGEDNNHRSYPTFQMQLTDLGIIKDSVIIDYYVWYAVPLFKENEKDWFSLATFSSYYDTDWPRTYLVNLDTNYKMHLMHVPVQGESSPDIFQTKILKMKWQEWVRITVFIDYKNGNRFKSPIIAVWQDERLVSASTFDDRVDPFALSPEEYPACLNGWDGISIESAEIACNYNYTGGLAQMHFGVYAPSALSTGTVYNDSLTVTEVLKTNE